MSAAPGRLRPRERIELGDYPVDAAWSARRPQPGRSPAARARVLLLRRRRARRSRSPSAATRAACWRWRGRARARLVCHLRAGRRACCCGMRVRSRRSRSTRGNEWSEQLAFADNGRLLAVATGRALQLFDRTGQARAAFAGQPGAIAALAWRPKGEEIAAVGNGGVRLHRLEPQLAVARLSLARRLPDRKLECRTAECSPAGMQDGSVHLWYVASGNQSQMRGWAPRWRDGLERQRPPAGDRRRRTDHRLGFLRPRTRRQRAAAARGAHRAPDAAGLPTARGVAGGRRARSPRDAMATRAAAAADRCAAAVR